MKKISLLIILCFLFTINIKAQYSQQSQSQATNQEINTEFATQINALFNPLDKSRIPHGILLDYGMEFTNLQAFNGTLSDSTYTTSQTITDIYKTLLMCRARQVNTGFIAPDEYAKRWYNHRTKQTIILSANYFKYSKFKDNALPSKINYSNNQFSDKYVNSTWQNPYEEKELFAIAPSVSIYKGFNFNVTLPQDLFLSNYPASVQNIQIDFSDGLGYRTVVYDQFINVNYTQANTYTWQYKINLTNGTTLYSHSKFVVEKGLEATFLENRQSNTTSGLDDYFKIVIGAEESYLDYQGSATVYIRYANGASNITKPLIVAEGFDTGIVLNPEQEAGENNIEDFLDNVDDSNSQLENEINTYDIIYVDWNNGVDFLQRNAFVLETVIKWVNQAKVGNEQNVIIGQSMGGLIARYALSDIEQNRNFNHDTKLYISHDAPHLGANAPLSIQYSARHLRNQYLQSPTAFGIGDSVFPLVYNFAEGFSNIINYFGGNTSVPTPITPLRAFSLQDVPAARQMQYNWVATNYQINNFMHEVWQNEYTQLGYPQGYTGQPIRNIAIANGSECGVTQPDNGNIVSYIKDAGKDTVLSNYIGLLDTVYGSLLLRPDITIASLFPGKSYWEIDFQSKYMTTFNQDKNIYHGSIKYKKKIFWFIPVSITITNVNINQPTNVLPFDIYGGGWQRPPSSSIPLSGIITNPFGFMPTASALDIGSSTTALNDADYRNSYIGALPPTAPKNTLFENFVTHFDRFNNDNNNSFHISFNRRNGNWLARELIGANIEYTDCSLFCADAPEFDIAGNDVVCPSGCDFSLNDSNGLSINWSIIQGSNLVNATDNGNTYHLSQANEELNGFITLQAVVGSGDCGFKTTTKQVWVGKPSEPTEHFYGVTPNFPDSPTNFFFELAKPQNGNFGQGEVLEKQYAVYPNNMDDEHLDLETETSMFVTTPEFVGVILNYTYKYRNQCGWSESNNVEGHTVDLGGGGGWNMPEPFPNSSDTSFKLDFTNKPATTQFYIYLYDQYQNIKYEGASNNVEKTINTMNLQNGVYYLHVYENGELKTKQIFVNH